MNRYAILALILISLLLSACVPAPSPAAPTAPPAPVSTAAATSVPAATSATAATSIPAATAVATKAAAAPAGPVNLSLFVFAAPGHKDIPRDVVNTYSASHAGASVQIVEGSNAQSWPQMLAAFKTTPDKPLFDFGYYNQTTHTNGVIAGLWDKIDVANVPNMKNILPQFRQPDDKGIAFATGYFGLVYNTKYIKDPPTSYAALWDPKYKGHVAIWDYQWYTLVVAARLNGGDEKNIDPGFALWSKNTDQIHSLVTSNQQLKDLMVSGNVWLAIFDIQQVKIWNEQEGAPVAGAIPKEGAIAWPLYLNITKGETPEKKKVAEEIINNLIAPEILAKYAAATYYAPTATNVTLPAALASQPSMDPQVLKNALVFDWETISKNNDAWSQRWDREIKAKIK